MKKLYFVFLMLIVVACTPTETTDTTEDQPPMSEDEVRAKEEGNKIDVLTQVPEGVSTLGNQFITGRTWMDANGENLLLFTFSEEIKPHESGDEAMSRSLYAEHFTRKKATQAYTLMRKIQDFENTCIFDNLLYLEDKSINITDLDQDQYKEISFVYTLGCLSDMSPYPMKLMLLENGEKYAVRGNTRYEQLLRTELGENAAIPKSTDKTFDASFDNAPKAFKNFADKLWDAHELK